MKAIRLHGTAGPSDLKYEDAPKPAPKNGEALIMVYVVAVTPLELTWHETYKTPDGRQRELPIPGHEVSGVIAELGDGSSDFRLGDEVYAWTSFDRDGAEAEFVIVRFSEMALKPKNLSHVQSAALTLSAITAWQAFFVHSDLQKGQRVLITGAAGGVGLFAVQLAKWKGAYVIGTGSTKNVEFIKGEGADEVVDYTKTELKGAVSGVDIVLDCVGGKTLLECDSAVKEDGVVISVASPLPSEEWLQSPGIKHLWFLATPNGQMLHEIATIADEGWLRPVIQRVLPLSEAQQAYAIGASGHVRGKIVLQVKE